MNIALPTLTIFFFLLPGLVFWRVKHSGVFSINDYTDSAFGIFIKSSIPSLILHFIWFHFNKLIFPSVKVDFEIIGHLLTATNIDYVSKNLEIYSGRIFIYNLSLILISVLLGWLYRNAIRKFKLDRKYKIFRFQNYWHYLINGEIFDFDDSGDYLIIDKTEDISLTFVDALIVINDKSYLYDGILTDYRLKKGGELSSISLKNARRRLLVDDAEILDDGSKKENHDNYYPIDGNILLLKYDEIKNLNFSYYKFELTDEFDLITKSIQ